MKWLDQAAGLLRQRAPLLVDEHIAEIVADLYRAWPHDTPAAAMAKFFRDIPEGGNDAPAAEAPTPATSASTTRPSAPLARAARTRRGASHHAIQEVV